MQKVYQYLKQYGEIDYLCENWWALRTDNPYWTMQSMEKSLS